MYITQIYFSFFYRICRINFNFKVFMSYQKHVVEDYNAVNVTFHVDINFDNKMYNNLILDIEATASELDRYHNGFWSRRRTTVVDAIVLVLLLISFWTYILSVFRSSMLAKVCVSYLHTCITAYTEYVLMCILY